MQASHTAALRDRSRTFNKAARHLLAEKGARAWSATEQSQFDTLVDAAENASEQAEATDLARNHSTALRAEHRAGLNIFMRKNPQQMSEPERRMVANTMSTTTPTQGGHSVGSGMADMLVSALKAYGYMRQVAGSFTTETGSPLNYPGSDRTGESGEQLAENASSASLDPSFTGVAMNTYKFGSKVIVVPIELLQDAYVDIVEMVLARAKQRIGVVLNQRFTSGTGSGQPNGLVTAATVGKTGTTGQTLTAIYDDLVDLIDSVGTERMDPPDAGQPALGKVASGWMMSQAFRKVARKIKDTSGRPIWTPSYDAEAGTTQTAHMLDFPVYLNNDMPAPAANAKSLAFGNLGNYMIRDVRQVVIRRFDDSPFMTLGQVGFLVLARAGGNLLDPAGVKLYQHSAT